MNAGYVLDAVRTPVGKLGGPSPASGPTTSPPVSDRHPELDPTRLDDVWLGEANAAGEDNRDRRPHARTPRRPPDLPHRVTIKPLCGSGIEAAVGSARAFETGDAALTIAGGDGISALGPERIGGFMPGSIGLDR